MAKSSDPPIEDLASHIATVAKVAAENAVSVVPDSRLPGKPFPPPGATTSVV